MPVVLMSGIFGTVDDPGMWDDEVVGDDSNVVALDTPWQQEITRAKADFLKIIKARGRRWLKPMGRSLAEMMKENKKPRPWIIQGIIREGAVVVLGGKPKGSKSLAKLEIIRAIASGEKAFGEFRVHKQGPVLTLDIETDEVDLGARGRALVNGAVTTIDKAFGNVLFEARENVDLLNDDECAVIIASARAMNPAPVLICIDPLRNAFEGEETNELLSTVMKRIGAMRDLTGAAFLIVHHLTKGTGDDSKRGKNADVGNIFDRFRGGGSLRGAWDAGIGFETLYRGKDGIKSKVEVELRQGQGAGIFGLDVEFRDDQWGDAVFTKWTHFDDPKEMMQESTEGEAIELLRGFDGRLSANAAAKKLGVSKDRAGDILDQLERKGLARFFEQGNRSGYEWCGGE
jgi:hypothetical protein